MELKARYFAPSWLPYPKGHSLAYATLRAEPQGLTVRALSELTGVQEPKVRVQLYRLQRGPEASVLRLEVSPKRQAEYLAQRLYILLIWGRDALAYKIVEWAELHQPHVTTELMAQLIDRIQDEGFVVLTPFSPEEILAATSRAAAFLNEQFKLIQRNARAFSDRNCVTIQDGASVVHLDGYRTSRAIQLFEEGGDDDRIEALLLLFAGLRRRSSV